MEQDNIIRVTPEMFGYKDRGIMKWQGMILADQTDALKAMEKENVEVEAKEEMTEEDISMLLYKAYITNSPVLIQANILKDDNYYKDVECKVAGYSEGRIYLNIKDGRFRRCTIDQIRNVEYMEVADWYDKQQ